MGIPFIGEILKPIFGVIDDAVGDKDKKRQLKADIQLAVLNSQEEITKAARDVIVSETQGNFLQRSWRPISMLAFVAILVNNFIIAPYVQAFGGVSVVLDVPPGMWGLLTVGMGGYVGGRTVEKGLAIWGQAQAKIAESKQKQ